jgi:hypothetical protein
MEERQQDAWARSIAIPPLPILGQLPALRASADKGFSALGGLSDRFRRDIMPLVRREHEGEDNL